MTLWDDIVYVLFPFCCELQFVRFSSGGLFVKVLIALFIAWYKLIKLLLTGILINLLLTGKMGGSAEPENSRESAQQNCCCCCQYCTSGLRRSRHCFYFFYFIFFIFIIIIFFCNIKFSEFVPGSCTVCLVCAFASHNIGLCTRARTVTFDVRMHQFFSTLDTIDILCLDYSNFCTNKYCKCTWMIVKYYFFEQKFK